MYICIQGNFYNKLIEFPENLYKHDVKLVSGFKLINVI